MLLLRTEQRHQHALVVVVVVVVYGSGSVDGIAISNLGNAPLSLVKYSKKNA